MIYIYRSLCLTIELYTFDTDGDDEHLNDENEDNGKAKIPTNKGIMCRHCLQITEKISYSSVTDSL